MTATIEKQTAIKKQTKAGEIYKEVYFDMLKRYDQNRRRLLLGEVDAKTSADKRAIELFLKEVFNSDANKYNGTGNYTNKKLDSNNEEWNGREDSIELNLPPLAMIAFKYK